MSELLYKDEVFKLVGLCMEVHRELGKGHDEVIYKDALIVELQRERIQFSREEKYEINTFICSTKHRSQATSVQGSI